MEERKIYYTHRKDAYSSFDIELEDFPDSIFWQRKPMIQYTPSITLHKSHIDGIGFLFPKEINTIEEGVIWLTHVYKFNYQFLAAPPPLLYKNTSFPWAGIDVNYTIPDHIRESASEYHFILLKYHIQKLMDYYNILSCAELDGMYDAEEFIPDTDSHSTKRKIYSGYIPGGPPNEKLFIYSFSPINHFQREGGYRSLWAMLLLKGNPKISNLIAYCDKTTQFATTLLNSNEDLEDVAKNKKNLTYGCTRRIDIFLDQVRKNNLKVIFI